MGPSLRVLRFVPIHAGCRAGGPVALRRSTSPCLCGSSASLILLLELSGLVYTVQGRQGGMKTEEKAKVAENRRGRVSKNKRSLSSVLPWSDLHLDT